MTITIRDEPSPTPATLIIHMGAGAVESVVSAAVKNYGDYRSVGANGLGMFAVSVFAVLDGVTETEIVEALPQRSFARSTIGAVTDAGFAVLATTIDDPDLAPEIIAIQRVHFDVMLPHLTDIRIEELDPLDDETLEAVARDHLVPHAERLLALFGRREHK